ncbi:hypothetical protein [Mycolicibacter algericus]|uniref:Uncharacterized protein n=2 Tax=Mycolicibacter algericus TaxID=1288388 RepID=A0A7I9Y9N0_MYCAL|nr:hypothetical protein [Mycolicibacter algericus]OQZ97646.1 hypothetical protein BST10_08525 [Mycolicibacter algericus DSM 45454]GFG85395.1 hypothetical protein MALGJ_20710 [Mycolicibacter algericus]
MKSKNARRRVTGAGTAVGAFLAVGIASLTTAPQACAEDFDIGAWFADPDMFAAAAEASFQQWVI